MNARRTIPLILMSVLACSTEPASPPADLQEPGEGGKADLWHSNQTIPLPFPSGWNVQISQGYHGYFTHHGDETYAVDFVADEGTEIAAVRSGRVVEAREGSNQGCATEQCADMANYIIVDHGDGTFGQYYHLRQNGVLPAVGQSVCRGEVIALSGNTGWSSGPHLHLQITNVLGETLPLLFEELEAPQGVPGGGPVDGLRGVPFPGAEAVSQNVPYECWGEFPASLCDADAFLHFGVRLQSEVPCSEATLDEEIPLRGVVYGAGGWLQVGQLNPASNTWQYQCVPVDPVTRAFDATMRWGSDRYAPGRGYFMMTAARYDPGAVEQCAAYGGWFRSVRVTLAAH